MKPFPKFISVRFKCDLPRWFTYEPLEMWFEPESMETRIRLRCEDGSEFVAKESGIASAREVFPKSKFPLGEFLIGP